MGKRKAFKAQTKPACQGAWCHAMWQQAWLFNGPALLLASRARSLVKKQHICKKQPIAFDWLII
jgi:hypothetical protein